MNEREALAFFLQAQRDVILAIVDGLDDQQVCRSVVPSGWTAIGMIEHLGDAERVWFQELVAGADPPPAAAVTNSDRPSLPTDVTCHHRGKPAWRLNARRRRVAVGAAGFEPTTVTL